SRSLPMLATKNWKERRSTILASYSMNGATTSTPLSNISEPSSYIGHHTLNVERATRWAISAEFTYYWESSGRHCPIIDKHWRSANASASSPHPALTLEILLSVWLDAGLRPR